MSPTEHLFLAFSGGLVLAGLALVGAAIQAYRQTERRVMVHLSIGFALVVAATAATAIGALLNDFQHPRALLVVHNGFSMFGYMFVIYSVLSYS